MPAGLPTFSFWRAGHSGPQSSTDQLPRSPEPERDEVRSIQLYCSSQKVCRSALTWLKTATSGPGGDERAVECEALMLSVGLATGCCQRSTGLSCHFSRQRFVDVRESKAEGWQGGLQGRMHARWSGRTRSSTRNPPLHLEKSTSPSGPSLVRHLFIRVEGERDARRTTFTDAFPPSSNAAPSTCLGSSISPTLDETSPETSAKLTTETSRSIDRR